MKTKVRFGSIGIGESFEWGGRSLVKDGDRTAVSRTPKSNFVFASKDMVTISETDIDDDDEVYNGFGFVPSGTTHDPQDLYDAYVYNTAGSDNIKDRCN